MDAIDHLPYDATSALGFRVLTKLANVAAQDGTRAWRLNSEMSRELGVSVRSIQRALRDLEEADLITRGDQRAVSHWRTDRRPTVYDVVMPSAQAGFDGVTGLSTDPDGVTNGATTVVAQRELRELLNSTTQSNQTEHVTPFSHVTGQCPVRGIRGHDFDAHSGYCLSCGNREDLSA
ncbi:MAG: hypothetical protein JWP75_2925 [Frondihabitans sp.]|nr:hypothetical protein [Frondihabitans sp.]